MLTRNDDEDEEADGEADDAAGVDGRAAPGLARPAGDAAVSVDAEGAVGPEPVIASD